ncbi:hypothetical protein Efla_001966 [Eimeria flavescens]
MASICRELTIKRKVVERNLKDLVYYRREVLEHQQVLQQMEAAGREASDIRQRRNVLTETLVMVPDAEERLAAACADLGLWVADHAAACAGPLALLRSSWGADPDAAGASAAEAGAEAAAKGEGKDEAELVRELAAARAALLQVQQEAPQLPLPLEVFAAPPGGDDPQGAPAEEEI